MSTRFSLGDALGATLAVALAVPLGAQGFDNRWATFAASPGSLSAGLVSDSQHGVDFAWADLDADGWTDLVCVRKKPGTSSVKRTNLLLMNEAGVLVDRTSTYATASDVAGDRGFATPTNDKDVEIVDVDNDGWLDVVTAVTLGDGDPKWLSHPRVYRNLGVSEGQWLGLRYEEARIPTLFTPAGLPAVPRFSSVAAGDVTGDGYADLYFNDHDDGVTGYSQPPGTDADDHLLINAGSGYFVDETKTRMQPAMYKGNFGTGAELVDLNGDGLLDIVRNTTNGPNLVDASYHDPAAPGTFHIYHSFYSSLSPYALATGDLNNDGRLDVIAGDDSADRFVYNTGNDPLGRVLWGPAKKFAFVWGSESEFVGNIRVADLDADGWLDVFACDVDVDVPSSAGRAHIYHNPGGVPGSFDITPIEERESATSSPGYWIGAVGFDAPALKASHDAAIFDLDRDGDLDVVLATFDGTRVYLNQLDPITCQEDLGFGGPGSVALSVCGDDLTVPGAAAALTLAGAAPLAPAGLFVGGTHAPTAILGGTLVPVPWSVLVPMSTNEQGSVSVSLAASSVSTVLYVQALVLNGSSLEFSNALKVVL
jgi:hypothetical protein